MEKKLSGKTNSQILIRNGIAYMPGIEARVVFQKGQSAPIQAVEKVLLGGDDLMPWGDNNDLPNQWELEVENDDTLRDTIEKSTDFLHGIGLEYGYITLNDKNQREYISHYSQKIEDFMEHALTKFAFGQMIRDYKIHGLPVPELIISNGMCMVGALPAAHFRFSKQDANGWINFGYFNRNWTLGKKSTSEDTKKIAVLDPLIDTIELIKTTNISNFVYRIPIPTHRTYYPLAPIYSAKTSKWLDIKSKQTKKFDSALDNEMSPKFHIEVDEDYMKQKYGKRWTAATERELEAIMLEELEHFHKMLHGTGNTGKNIITTKRIEQTIKKEYSSWTFSDLKGTTYEKGDLELLHEADSHIRQAGSIDKTLQGAGQGSGMGAGSGSDKREAFNIMMSTASRHLAPILDVFNWAFEYNGFKGPNGEKIRAMVVMPQLQTQNNVTPSQRDNNPKQ